MNKFELNYSIDNYIERISDSGIVRSFYPNAISKKINIPLTPVLERLSRLVDDGILELKFEIRCHEGSHIIDIVDDYSDCLNKGNYCTFCGEETYIELSNIAPIYYISESYREFLKKKKRLNTKKTKETQSKNLAMMT